MACLSEARDLRDVRDMLTHVDEYASGTAKLQQSVDGTDGLFD